ncbi:hypothetical protein [Humibacter ginsenosidimutans]|uniref:hypothetical protein n=1 Tax=Humibacter ginsenosidimutans TaxID=2599293 RepID=UPI00143DF6CE|nr:hypothetical protein [Humibacter ginsenosidimutans]
MTDDTTTARWAPSHEKAVEHKLDGLQRRLSWIVGGVWVVALVAVINFIIDLAFTLAR